MVVGYVRVECNVEVRIGVDIRDIDVLMIIGNVDEWASILMSASLDLQCRWLRC